MFTKVHCSYKIFVYPLGLYLVIVYSSSGWGSLGDNLLMQEESLEVLCPSLQVGSDYVAK